MRSAGGRCCLGFAAPASSGQGSGGRTGMLGDLTLLLCLWSCFISFSFPPQLILWPLCPAKARPGAPKTRWPPPGPPALAPPSRGSSYADGSTVQDPPQVQTHIPNFFLFLGTPIPSFLQPHKVLLKLLFNPKVTLCPHSFPCCYFSRPPGAALCYFCSRWVIAVPSQPLSNQRRVSSSNRWVMLRNNMCF